MNYNLTGKVNKKFILDDSEVIETVNIIENITNRKLNIEICLFSLHLRLITKLYMW